VQRRWLEAARRATRNGVESQRRLVRAFADSGDAQRAARRQTTAALDSVVESTFVAARASTGDGGVDDVEARVEQGLGVLDDAREEWWETTSRTLNDGADAYDSLLGAYADILDAGFAFALDANEIVASNAGWMAQQSARMDQGAGEP